MSNEGKVFKSAAVFKAIGHPIRIQIVRALSNTQSMTVTELTNVLSIDQPVMSLHLAILRKTQIISVEKKGKNSFYSISDTSLKQVVNIIYNTRN